MTIISPHSWSNSNIHLLIASVFPRYDSFCAPSSLYHMCTILCWWPILNMTYSLTYMWNVNLHNDHVPYDFNSWMHSTIGQMPAVNLKQYPWSATLIRKLMFNWRPCGTVIVNPGTGYNIEFLAAFWTYIGIVKTERYGVYPISDTRHKIWRAHDHKVIESTW